MAEVHQDDQNASVVAAELHLAVMRLARRLRAERPGGLTSTQMSALATLNRSGALPISALAAAEGVRHPSMTRTVGALVEQGLADRHPDPADRRVSLVEVTKEGEALIQRTRRARQQWLAQRIAGMSAAERAELHDAAALIRMVAEE